MLGLGAICKSTCAKLEEWMFLDPWITAAISNDCKLGLDFSLFVVACSYRQEKSGNVVTPPYTSSVKNLNACWNVEWVCQRKAEGQARTTWAITGKRAASFEFSGQLKLRIINDSESLGHLMWQLLGNIQTQNLYNYIKGIFLSNASYPSGEDGCQV